MLPSVKKSIVRTGMVLALLTSLPLTGRAAYVGFTAELIEQDHTMNNPTISGTWDVWRVYAQFNHTNDQLLAVFGDISFPANFFVKCSPVSYFQDAENASPDLEPNPLLVVILNTTAMSASGATLEQWVRQSISRTIRILIQAHLKSVLKDGTDRIRIPKRTWMEIWPYSLASSPCRMIPPSQAPSTSPSAKTESMKRTASSPSPLITQQF